MNTARSGDTQMELTVELRQADKQIKQQNKPQSAVITFKIQLFKSINCQIFFFSDKLSVGPKVYLNNKTEIEIDEED